MIFKKHKAKIEKGKLILQDKESFNNDLLKYDGDDVWVIVRPIKFDITPSQRGYYFGVIIPILMEATGYSKNEMHEALKAQYHVETISNMNTDEMSTFIKNIKEDFAEYNIPESYEVEFS